MLEIRTLTNFHGSGVDVRADRAKPAAAVVEQARIDAVSGLRRSDFSREESWQRPLYDASFDGMRRHLGFGVECGDTIELPLADLLRAAEADEAYKAVTVEPAADAEDLGAERSGGPRLYISEFLDALLEEEAKAGDVAPAKSGSHISEFIDQLIEEEEALSANATEPDSAGEVLVGNLADSAVIRMLADLDGTPSPAEERDLPRPPLPSKVGPVREHLAGWMEELATGAQKHDVIDFVCRSYDLRGKNPEKFVNYLLKCPLFVRLGDEWHPA